jgi:predicted metal-binding membrane protein
MLLVSLAAWAGLFALSNGSAVFGCCIPISARGGPSGLVEVLVAGWLLMIFAMMGPLMPMGLGHAMDRSFASRKWRVVPLFLLGYVGTWMVAGLLIPSSALLIRWARPDSYAPAVFALGIAAVYQFSPLKQVCLNRGHGLPELAAFGWAADRDVFLFAVEHALWCGAACAPLMFTIELLPAGHLAAMAIGTGWLVAEKYERPRGPSWRVRGVATVGQLAVWQVLLWRSRWTVRSARPGDW